MAALTNGLDINLFTGFMAGFGKSGDQLTENTKNLNESAHLLGEGLGNLATQVTGATVQISQSVQAINQYLRDKFPHGLVVITISLRLNSCNGAVGGSAERCSRLDKIKHRNRYSERWPCCYGLVRSGTWGCIRRYGCKQLQPIRQSLRDGAMALPSTPAMSYQVNPVFNLTVAPEVPLTLVSDASRLSDYIDFQARASARSFEQSLTLQINSGQSTAGG
jgi:hypothetical protein